MKHVLYIILIASVVSCTYNGPPEVTAPYYMTKLADSPGWKSKFDFLRLNIDGHLIERGYGSNGPDNLILPNSYLGNWGPSPDNVAGVHSNLFTFVKGELYPNLPFKIGDDWAFNDSTTLSITSVYMTGIGVTIALPKAFDKNLKYGFYRLKDNSLNVGISITNQWTVSAEDSLGEKYVRSYLLNMEPRGKRKVEITGIDTNNSAEIRITANFEGVFAADRFLVEEMGEEFELEESGSFSFVINR